MNLDPMSMDLDAARLAVVELKRTLALRDDELRLLRKKLILLESQLQNHLQKHRGGEERQRIQQSEPAWPAW